MTEKNARRWVILIAIVLYAAFFIIKLNYFLLYFIIFISWSASSLACCVVSLWDPFRVMKVPSILTNWLFFLTSSIFSSLSVIFIFVCFWFETIVDLVGLAFMLNIFR